MITYCFWIGAGGAIARFFGILKVTQDASAFVSIFFEPQDITGANVTMDPADQPHDNENCQKKKVQASIADKNDVEKSQYHL